MASYRVTYETVLEAASHEDAARTVAKQMAEEDRKPILSVALQIKGRRGPAVIIDVEALPKGWWYIFDENGHAYGPYDSYSEAEDVAEEMQGILKFVEMP